MRAPTNHSHYVNDSHKDYRLKPYHAITGYHQHSHSSKILNASITGHPEFACVNKAFQIVQSAVGHNRTVWGIKQSQTHIWWELYFYPESEFQKMHPLLKTVLSCFYEQSQIEPLCELLQIDHFMFSIEVPLAQEPLIHVYLNQDNAFNCQEAGTSFDVSENGLLRANQYYFWHEPALQHLQDIKSLIYKSPYFSQHTNKAEDLLIPQLLFNRGMCVSYKRSCDGIYFQGLQFPQLELFLKKFGFSTDLCNFISSSKQCLDHYLFDVGFDYRFKGRELELIKASFYGIL